MVWRLCAGDVTLWVVSLAKILVARGPVLWHSGQRDGRPSLNRIYSPLLLPQVPLPQILTMKSGQVST